MRIGTGGAIPYLSNSSSAICSVVCSGKCRINGSLSSRRRSIHGYFFPFVCTPRDARGGDLTVKDGRTLAELPLPVCEILSDRGVEEEALGLKAVRESLEELGYRHGNPIMSLGTLGLPVSPALKLTDMGLVDVKKSAVVPLIVE